MGNVSRGQVKVKVKVLAYQRTYSKTRLSQFENDSEFVTGDQLAGYITQDQLENYVTQDQLNNFITEGQLANLVTKADLANSLAELKAWMLEQEFTCVCDCGGTTPTPSPKPGGDLFGDSIISEQSISRYVNANSVLNRDWPIRYYFYGGSPERSDSDLYGGDISAYTVGRGVVAGRVSDRALPVNLRFNGGSVLERKVS